RYWRVTRPDGATLIVMDAPPDKEDIGPYLRSAELLRRLGVHVPAVHAVERAQGFVLLEDLGTQSYLAALRAGADPDALYADATAALLRLQLRGLPHLGELAPYDAATLDREMALMAEWYCERHLRLELTADEQRLLADTLVWIRDQVLQQPRVLVHRDYHSRNLMVLAHGNPGVIDFQDALAGPVAYDLVSLFKDCYIAWPRPRVLGWLRDYRRALADAPGGAALAGSDEREFVRWFDIVGLQRHIKVLGIFARLWYRDGKPGYLADLPRTLSYVRDAAARCTELQEFARWIEARLVAGLAAANARCGVVP
ncbi:MAG: phosphotransferase, partial [Steroidobacteraceae bacterium]|nr:phosphotransferase [Steroidobacteraceae bacterium]MDW8258989.1 phosphotransferase [Gammaproteobacteria bacterium]